jgi:prophage DNA circulation protein
MSTECRDWLKTLWPASYKGVPFFFDSDDEEGGRGLVIHKFPNRDDPFVEDLGEEPRFYSGVGYVHGDNADTLAASLKETLASAGPGTLVVPYFGPVTVRCQTFKRSTEREKLGYVAFEMKFVRDGALNALISVEFSQASAYQAIDRLGAAIASLFPVALSTFTEPDHVVAAAADQIAAGAATLDVIRQSYAVDPVVSAKARDEIANIIAAIPSAISADAKPQLASTPPSTTSAPLTAGDLAQSVFTVTREVIGAISQPASAKRASLSIVSAFTYTPPATPILAVSAQLAADNQVAAMAVVRLAAMAAYADSVLRMTFKSRPDGVSARGEVAERFENELYNTTGAENAALYVALEDLRGSVIDYLSRLINDLAPIITVDTARSRPSLDMAWILYADPTRADELAQRNAVRHPSIMPKHFTALAR